MELILLLQAWVGDMSDFLKGLDPNHLVMVGSWGYFGASTPALLPENPSDFYSVKFLDTVLFPADRICHGEDSSAILSLPSIDLASMHLYPEYWSFCTSCAALPVSTCARSKCARLATCAIFEQGTSLQSRWQGGNQGPQFQICLHEQAACICTGGWQLNTYKFSFIALHLLGMASGLSG